jgi:3-keto-disaccharide hydrolase
MPLSRVLAACLCLLLTTAAAPRSEQWNPLWNGRNLDGWSTWLSGPAPASPVFSVVPDVDGRAAIRISGQVFGEMRTTESFQNYHVRLQFKWGVAKWPPRDKPETPRDSGLLYHVHAPPGENGRVWARSIELQIQEHDVGDLYAIGSAIGVRAKRRSGSNPPEYEYDPHGEWWFFSQSHGSLGRCIKQPDNEKPTGEWNTVELVAFGEESIHIVNGKVVMRLRHPLRIDRDKPELVTSGPLILQSEGAEVFYRDIEIRPITAIPSEFAER